MVVRVSRAVSSAARRWPCCLPGVPPACPGRPRRARREPGIAPGGAQLRAASGCRRYGRRGRLGRDRSSVSSVTSPASLGTARCRRTALWWSRTYPVSSATPTGCGASAMQRNRRCRVRSPGTRVSRCTSASEAAALRDLLGARAIVGRSVRDGRASWLAGERTPPSFWPRAPPPDRARGGNLRSRGGERGRQARQAWPGRPGGDRRRR